MLNNNKMLKQVQYDEIKKCDAMFADRMTKMFRITAKA